MEGEKRKAYKMKNGVFWDVTPCASFTRVTRIGELGTKLAVTSNRGTLGIPSHRVSIASYS
jgi:hypothetical protein